MKKLLFLSLLITGGLFAQTPEDDIYYYNFEQAFNNCSFRSNLNISKFNVWINNLSAPAAKETYRVLIDKKNKYESIPEKEVTEHGLAEHRNRLYTEGTELTAIGLGAGLIAGVTTYLGMLTVQDGVYSALLPIFAGLFSVICTPAGAWDIYKGYYHNEKDYKKEVLAENQKRQENLDCIQTGIKKLIELRRADLDLDDGSSSED